MEKITSIEQLELHILTLEVQLAKDLVLIKEQLNITNLITSKIEQFICSEKPEKDSNNLALSVGAGCLAKKLVVGSSDNTSRNIIGEILKVTVTALVYKNVSQIKSKGIDLILNFLTKRNKDS